MIARTERRIGAWRHDGDMPAEQAKDQHSMIACIERHTGEQPHNADARGPEEHAKGGSA